MNTLRKALLSLPAFALSVAMMHATPVQAADALEICRPGVPYAYPNGGAGILWNPDQGDLGPLTNAEAIAAADQSFDAWEDLPQSTVTFRQGATLDSDINIDNFAPVLNPPAPNGLNEIVFDANGEIFALLYGPGSGIRGFAGPVFVDPETCLVLESSAWLNGRVFVDEVGARDTMVHEFGHFINLGHVELNGQLVCELGVDVYFEEGCDSSGATPDSTTFGVLFPTPSYIEFIETMYPICVLTDPTGSPGPPGCLARGLPHADDIASIAMIYPAPTFSSSTGTITGTIRMPNGVPLSGVNVIARRLNATGTGGDGYLSFTDAVSTFSGAYTDDTDPSDPNVGVYTLSNLTHGAQYAVFVDVVTAQAGRFSNPITAPLPGPEEYYNGASESSDPNVDDPLEFVAITALAGTPVEGIDIIFNQPGEGEPLDVGEDGSVRMSLPFDFCIQGQAFDSVFINANGHLTFGEPGGVLDYVVNVTDFRDGPPALPVSGPT